MTAWHVVSQTTMAGGGEITYETDDGNQHTIFVGTPDYNERRIASLINAEITTRDKVAQLSGDTGPQPGG